MVIREPYLFGLTLVVGIVLYPHQKLKIGLLMRDKKILQNPITASNFLDVVTTILAKAKKLGATAAEVGASVHAGFNVNVRKAEVDTVEFNRDKGIGITVYFGKRKGNASTSDIGEEAINKTLQAAVDIAKFTSEDQFSGLAAADLMAYDYPELDLYYPWELTPEQAIELAKECEGHAFAVDKRLINTEGTSVATGGSYSVYGNSHGFLGAYARSSHSISCSMVASDNGNMEADYGSSVARDQHDLRSLKVIAEEAATRSLRRLNARKIKTCQAPILFEAHIACSILSHFFSAIRGGNLYRQSSFLVDHLGKAIFPHFIQIEEKPFVAKGLASSPFDAEGVKLQDRYLVRDGILESYILSSYSARKLNMQTTGNAGGTHNLYCSTSDKSLNDLIKIMGKGILVTEVMGQGVNIVTGDYSQGATGFWVENGEIQYPIHEFTIAGNLKEMFQQVIAIGNDIYPNSSLKTGSLLIGKMTVAGE